MPGMRRVGLLLARFDSALSKLNGMGKRMRDEVKREQVRENENLDTSTLSSGVANPTHQRVKLECMSLPTYHVKMYRT